jgi:hypothetical protein
MVLKKYFPKEGLDKTLIHHVLAGISKWVVPFKPFLTSTKGKRKFPIKDLT